MKKIKQHRKKIALTFFVVVMIVVCSIGQSAVAQQPKNSQQTKLANKIYPRLLKMTMIPMQSVREKAGSIHSRAPIAAPSIYTFTGKGRWSDPSNWENQLVPPAKLKPGDQIVINGTSWCLLNNSTPLLVPAGSSIEIKEGKELYVTIGNNFVVRGNLINNGKIKVLSGTLVTTLAEANTIPNKGRFMTTTMSRIVESKISQKK